MRPYISPAQVVSCSRMHASGFDRGSSCLAVTQQVHPKPALSTVYCTDRCTMGSPIQIETLKSRLPGGSLSVGCGDQAPENLH